MQRIYACEQSAEQYIEACLVELARAHGGDDGAIVGAERGGHLQMQAGADAGDAFIHRTPIRDHNALETPLLLQKRAGAAGVEVVD